MVIIFLHLLYGISDVYSVIMSGHLVSVEDRRLKAENPPVTDGKSNRRPGFFISYFLDFLPLLFASLSASRSFAFVIFASSFLFFSLITAFGTALPVVVIDFGPFTR